MKHAAYMICTAPRSGSTLLCGMLAATGIAGDPDSLFYESAVGDWAARMGVAPVAATERETLDAVMQAAITMGRGATPVFGLRQQRPSFAFLCQKLAVLHPGAVTDRERIERSFGPVRFIHLTRADKLAQAVSMLKARGSGLWHVAPDGSELERTAAHFAAGYDADRIRDYIDRLTEYDRGWNDWFDREGVDPLRLTYDGLSAEPLATLRRVLDWLGLDAQAADGVKPGVRKMADATSKAWIERFRADGSRVALIPDA
ncbi:MAG: Stf0 family sulfotransferase [Pararhodobacter sp.]